MEKMSNLIERQAAIDVMLMAIDDGWEFDYAVDRMNELPAAQPEIIRCKDCVYFDPPHVKKNGVRYEYSELPEDAFDELGTGLVTAEYGINIGGRCTRDYNVGYSEDKRVYVSENNFCGRAGRRTDNE